MFINFKKRGSEVIKCEIKKSGLAVIINLFNGMKFYGVQHLNEIRCFGVHMFHEIKSANRSKDRGDARKVHQGERY